MDLVQTQLALAELRISIEFDDVFDVMRKPGIKYVPGTGQCFRPVVMFIGEAPGPMENAKGTPFIGSAGAIFRKLLDDTGLNDFDIYITNVFKYMPCKENSMNFRKPNGDEIERVQPYLAKEIRIVDPKIICLMGNIPIRAFFKGETSVSKLHGEFFNYDPAVFISYHPSVVQYKEHILPLLRRDFNRLADRVKSL